MPCVAHGPGAGPRGHPVLPRPVPAPCQSTAPCASLVSTARRRVRRPRNPPHPGPIAALRARGSRPPCRAAGNPPVAELLLAEPRIGLPHLVLQARARAVGLVRAPAWRRRRGAARTPWSRYLPTAGRPRDRPSRSPPRARSRSVCEYCGAAARRCPEPELGFFDGQWDSSAAARLHRRRRAPSRGAAFEARDGLRDQHRQVVDARGLVGDGIVGGGSSTRSIRLGGGIGWTWPPCSPLAPGGVGAPTRRRDVDALERVVVEELVAGRGQQLGGRLDPTPITRLFSSGACARAVRIAVAGADTKVVT